MILEQFYLQCLAHASYIVGDEASVTSQLEALIDAGATDIWAAPFPVGPDKNESRERTNTLLKSLTG